jgi:hypothetical protein
MTKMEKIEKAIDTAIEAAGLGFDDLGSVDSLCCAAREIDGRGIVIKIYDDGNTQYLNYRYALDLLAECASDDSPYDYFWSNAGPDEVSDDTWDAAE